MFKFQNQKKKKKQEEDYILVETWDILISFRFQKPVFCCAFLESKVEFILI
jgi:hypothetical protein